MIHCQCEHASHFEHDEHPDHERDNTNIFTTVGHHYGARVNYVVQGGYGIYQCGACEQAGHSPMSREQAIKHNKAIVSGFKRGSANA